MKANGREIIKDGYRRGLPVAEIARLADSTPGSVKATASRMKLLHPLGAPQRRLPPPLAQDYRTLNQKGRYSSIEALRILGVSP